MWCPRSLGAAAGVLLLCLMMVVAVTSQNVNNIRPISRSLKHLFRLFDHHDHIGLLPTIHHVLPAHPWRHPWRHVHPPLSPVYGHYPYSLWHHPHSLSPYTPHPSGPFHHDPVRVLALQSPGHVYPRYHHHHHHHGHAYYPHHHRRAYYPYYPSWHGPYRYPHAHAYYPYPHAHYHHHHKHAYYPYPHAHAYYPYPHVPAYYPPHPVPYHPWQPHYPIPPVPYYPYHPIVANYGHVPVNATHYPVPFYPHYPMTPAYSPIAPVHPPYAPSPYVPVPHPPYAPYAHIHPAYTPHYHPSAPYAPAPYWPPDYIHMWPLHPDTYHAWTQEGGCSWERPFPCWGMGTCIPISAVCDKQYDCGNYLDEDSRLCVSGKRPSVHLMQMFFALPAQSWMENKLFNNRDSYYVAVAFKFALTMADLTWALTLSEEAVNNTKAAFAAASGDDKAPMTTLGMKDEDWPITKYLFKTLIDTGFVVS